MGLFYASAYADVITLPEGWREWGTGQGAGTACFTFDHGPVSLHWKYERAPYGSYMFPNAFNIAVYDRDTGGTVTYYYYDGSNPSETTVTLEGLTPGIMYVLSWGVGVSAGWGFDHSGSAELTLDLTDLGDTSPPVPVVIDVAGDTITPNTRSITCNIWPPDGYNVADIVVGSIRLQGTISPASTSVRKGKMLVAKFPTTELGLQAGDVLELKVTGQLGDGASFEGSDSITVVHKGGK